MRLILNLAVACLIFVAIGCTKDDKQITEIEAETNATENGINKISIENGILTFNDENSFHEAINLLNTLSSEKRIQWESQIGFKSMQTLCETLSDELALVESEDDYFKIRATYQNLVFFGEPGGNDQAFYIPLEKMMYMPIVDVNGNVKIGEELKNFKSDAIMKRLKGFENPLKAAGDDFDHCKKFKTRNVQILCLLEDAGFNKVHLYISTQNHNFFGWNNNVTKRIIEFIGPITDFGYGETGFTLPYTYSNGLTTNVFTTNSDKYTNIYFQRNNSYTYAFKIWGNGFSYSEACQLNLPRIY
jgi:hypothetical protein